MSDTDLIDASIHSGIEMGSCVVIENDKMVYAGPLGSSPDASGKLILLHPDDFAQFVGYVDTVKGLASYLRRH